MGPRERLNDYLDSVRDKAFEWGKFDCLIFTNNAFKAMYGQGWADDWLNRYMDGTRVLRRSELRKEYKHSTLIPAIDKKLKRIDFVPPLGALLASDREIRFNIGYVLGVSVGTKACYLGKNGLIWKPFETVNYAWVKQ